MKKFLVLFTSILLAVTFLVSCDILPGGNEPTPTPVAVITEEDTNLNVISEGRLVPLEDELLVFMSSGEVAEVLVANGDRVSQGQVLARLADVEQYETAITAANLELESAQQEYDSLLRLAELNKAESWNAWIGTRDGVIGASRVWDQIDSKDTQEDIEDAEEDVIEAQSDLEDAQEKFDKYAGLPEGNKKRKNAVEDLDDAQNDYNEAVRKRDSLINAQEQARANLDIALEREAEAKRTYDLLLDGVDPEKLALSEKRLENAKAQLSAAQAALDNMELKAPFSGNVVDVNIIPGQVYVPGTWAMQLADFSKWYLETTDLTEIEVVKIKQGQKVTAILDALKDLELSGIVEEINQVPGNQSGDVVYVVRIQLDESNPLFRWGMTAEINFE